MDEIEITVFDEITDYKEKIYFFNFRQWIFAILIAVLVIPTYILLKDKIGEEPTSYIVIAIAGILGFVGFVKIHELPAERILPYWFRHYFLFAKPIHYISDKEYEFNHSKEGRKLLNEKKKAEIKEMKKKKMLEKAKKKYESKQNKKNAKKQKEDSDFEKFQAVMKDDLSEKLSNLTKEEQELLLKLLNKNEGK